MSKSYTNLFELANGNFSVVDEPKPRRLSRAMTEPGIISDLDYDNDEDDDQTGSVSTDRMIIVANQLPVNAIRVPNENGEGQSWDFTWDENSLYLHIKDGLPPEMEVIYFGTLKAEVDPNEQDEVSQTLLDQFKCVPVFIPPTLLEKYYHGFCKQHLWPIFHYMLPLSENRFDRSLWEAYVTANVMFSQKISEVVNPYDDYVWIHDYHLMVLPTFLRRRFNKLRIGFFLHSPFPSTEIFRTLAIREEILKSLLNADLIGFHTFDYARHFLACCSRMLGLEYESKRGYIALEYYGRSIGIKIMPSGIHMGKMESILNEPEKKAKVLELEKEFEGKTVLIGVDDTDVFKGVNLKLLAMEQMLKSHPSWVNRAVLVQILNPARGKGKDVQEVETEIKATCERINNELGSEGYKPIVLIDRKVSLTERAAYYTVSEAAIVTAVRDGMNLTPYEYVVCRNESQKSMLVVSEFIGCSPSLSGAIRVNPWNVHATSEAINDAISISDDEKHMRHEKHYRYISSHDVAYWSRSFFQELEVTCSDHFRKRCWGMGLSFGFRVLSLDPKFRKLTTETIVDSYKKAENRAILLDYDGTLIPPTSNTKDPSNKVISVINKLCNDPKNTVFVISGRRKDCLGKWFAQCEKLGVAAEHGYFIRWDADKEWETCGKSKDFGWIMMAEPVMELYTETTDGSYIEKKESALVWHHQHADRGFGCSQAKEMLEHLESVLANEPVEVKSGQYIVEVKQQGVTKGLVADKIFSSMVEKGKRADFVLCIGDDRSDEDMFVTIGDAIKKGVILNDNNSVFACTVGQKPSKAEYYLDDSREVLSMLETLLDSQGDSGNPGSSST